MASRKDRNYRGSTSEDQFYVLEDNARTPSGVSYMLENRGRHVIDGRVKMRTMRPEQEGGVRTPPHPDEQEPR